MRVACIIIASAQREAVLDSQVVPSALAAGFSEVLVVGDYHPGTGYRYVPVPAMTATTVDALIKRDIGTLATTADWLFYLCDDHAVRRIGKPPTDPMTIGVPTRTCRRDGMVLLLNMGLDPRDPNAPYCGGHAGLFSRELIQAHRWTTMPHDRLWDLLSSRLLVLAGATLTSLPTWEVEDIEPESTPWL